MKTLPLLLMIASAASAATRDPPPTIDELRQTAPAGALRYERELDGGRSFTAYLVSYECRGLQLHALVAVPRGARPASGFPVVVANHGTHPDPPRYGITAQGIDSRPGDYYRDVPELYASQGFMVVMPDYRGHNVSEGLEYARGFLASSYYAQDVIALIGALPSLESADTGNVFMWGHSLGGEVTLKALLATDVVKGASLWSTVGGDIWDQAYFYSLPKPSDELYDSSAVAKQAVIELRREVDSFGPSYDWRRSDPLRYLDRLGTPLLLQHAIGDEGARFEWSRRLARELYLLGRRYELYAYPGDEHFFSGSDRLKAAERDGHFFRSLMRARN